MAPPKSTNAEWCKKYRQTHRDESRQADALRERNARMKIRLLDNEKYQVHKKKDKIRKKDEQLRVTLAIESNDNANSPNSSSSSYKHKSIKMS